MLSDFVKYVKQYWHDRPDKSTPLNADRLNHIENGIEANTNAIDEIAKAVVSNIVNDPDKIASMAAVYTLQEKLGTGDLPSDAPDVISAINALNSNLPSPTGLLIQHGHEHDYNPTDHSISVTFEKPYTQWVQVFCNVPATMENGYFHVATVESITWTGCILHAKAFRTNDSNEIDVNVNNPSEGIQWVAIGV